MNIGLPECCPTCGGKVEILTSKDGVKDLFCVNPNCPAKTNVMVTAFLERLGVMGVSNATIMDWNIHSVSDLVNFKALPSRKSEVNFADELDRKLWVATKKDIFLAMSAFIPGVGKKEMKKFWEKFGGVNVLEPEFAASGSAYVKEQQILDSLAEVCCYCEQIFTDGRFKGADDVQVDAGKSALTKGTICFTGKLETMTRSEAQNKARTLGYEIADGVSKTLGTLVVADAALEGAPSSKLKKARSLGVKIMAESEFNAL